MSLGAGSRIGPYEVLGLLGAGGMGEVYRARDTKIGRDVALKVLPALFTDDPERLARFEREAQALGALNHPNIAQIHGFEQAGQVRAIVMELVEGEDLSRRIAEGPMPVQDTLAVARQIAHALEAAHDQGIVHRDLKPANVKVRDDGVVKVLDFGLAKAVTPEAGSATPGAMNSPTLTARATELGIILGTAAYMSPEQAKGKAVDKRADVWAFGVVVYEMLTGQRAFKGDDVSETLASVLAREPDLGALPADTPPALRRLLARCLEKDPKTRLRDVGDAMRQLDAELSDTTGSTVRGAETNAASSVPPARASLQRWLLLAGGLAVGLAAGTGLWAAMSPAPASPEIVRFDYRPSAQIVNGGPFKHLAISPDGRTLVYTAREAGAAGLYVRRLDELTDAPLRGAEGGSLPFFSPDGEWVGFVDLSDNTVIKKVSIHGGAAQRVVQASNPVYGATWTSDDAIVFSARGDGLFEVPGGGGDSTRITERAAGRFGAWPSAIPGTRLVVFSDVQTGMQPLVSGRLTVLDRDTRAVTTFDRTGSVPRYVPTGHLVWAADAGSVMAAPFDLGRREFTGNPVPLVEGVEIDSSGVAQVTVSEAGHVAYLAFGGLVGNRTLAWVDREGRETPITDEPRAYVYARLSPDEQRLSLDIREENQDIWILDLARLTLSRLTFDPGPDNYAEWFPDSVRVVVGSRQQGRANPDLAVYRANGTGQADWLTDTTEEIARVPNAVTPDGKTVIFRGPLGERQDDLFTVPVDGDRNVETLLSTEHSELNAALSPDGRWMAFQSNASGRFEVYVKPFPNVNDGLWQLSRGGGSKPVWSRDGREVFFVSADTRMMAVPVAARDTFAPGTPEALFDASAYHFGAPGRNYDVSKDGRFVMIREPETGGSSRAITVVLNWFEELRAIR